MTDDYTASLEKRIEELEQQQALLSHSIRPYFKILVKDDVVKCLQLYVKVYHGLDPLQEWVKSSPGNPQNPATYQVVVDVSNMEDPGNPSGNNLLSHFEATGEKTWKGLVFKQDKNMHYEVDDADHTEMKSIMLNLTGLTGFAYGSHTEPYVSKEERMKPVIEEMTKKISEWNAKTGMMGVSARNMWSVTQAP